MAGGDNGVSAGQVFTICMVVLTISQAIGHISMWQLVWYPQILGSVGAPSCVILRCPGPLSSPSLLATLPRPSGPRSRSRRAVSPPRCGVFREGVRGLC